MSPAARSGSGPAGRRMTVTGTEAPARPPMRGREFAAWPGSPPLAAVWRPAWTEDDEQRLEAALWRFIHPDLAGSPADPYHDPDEDWRRPPAMKLTTEPAALAAAVKFAARALTARAAYPILGGLKITAADGGMEVAAFDYETSARARIGADVGEPGTVLAPGRLLAAIAAQLPRQPVELSSDGAALTLTAGRTRYILRLLPADDYPALPELAAPAGQADAAELAAAVRQVVVAASRDDTLPALCAIQVTFTRRCDHHGGDRPVPGRAPRTALAALGDQLPPPILIPAPAFADVARDTGDDPVQVHGLTGTDGARPWPGSPSAPAPSPPG